MEYDFDVGEVFKSDQAGRGKSRCIQFNPRDDTTPCPVNRFVHVTMHNADGTQNHGGNHG
jgi:hypothetical protein